MERLIQALLDKPNEANAVIAFCALVISVLTFYVALRTIQLQRKHNYLSVRPLVWIAAADYEGA